MMMMHTAICTARRSHVPYTEQVSAYVRRGSRRHGLRVDEPCASAAGTTVTQTAPLPLTAAFEQRCRRWLRYGVCDVSVASTTSALCMPSGHPLDHENQRFTSAT
jgi:hypothetical protein